MSTNDFPVLSFETSSQWEKWLEKNHKNSAGVWIRYFKKASGIATITYAQALDEALCFGWIDGQARPYDEKSWLQKYTPRRPKNTWSKRNTQHIERLLQLNKMREAGLQAVEYAKADGRWDQAYDSPSQMKIPDDFLKELEKDKKVYAFFKSLNKANLYAIAWRLQTAKKPETRTKRVSMILSMLENGEKFH